MPSADYLKSLFGLDGLTAVVVGGTGTLGGAFCDALAGAGAFVYVVGRDAPHGAARVAAIQAAGGQAEFFSLDATRREDYEALKLHLAAASRPCDILINGAGINAATPFLEIPDDEWDRIFAVNVKSVRLGCQVFGEEMLERPTGGSIINIASVSSEIPLSRVYSYSASKAAVVSLTRNLAREWGPRKVRVNALSPGFFPAEQNRKVLTPDRIAKVMAHTPMARFGSPEELAGAVLLMASPRAGSFLTGANIYVDGGFTAQTI
jgi:NAD(P)-dependent dehydrogenase (short-subunit alcohol dehydrogenase family)